MLKINRDYLNFSKIIIPNKLNPYKIITYTPQLKITNKKGLQVFLITCKPFRLYGAGKTLSADEQLL